MFVTIQGSKQIYVERGTFYRTTDPVSLQQVNDIEEGKKKKKRKGSGDML